MNRRQKNQDKRVGKIVAVLNDHATEVASIPAMADADAELRRQAGLVQPAVSQQIKRRQTKGATRAKNDLEAPLIGQTVKAANALHLYYKQSGQPDLADALHIRRSEYSKMSQPDLMAETQDVADQLTAHIGSLARYGFKKADPKTNTPGDDEKYQAQVTAYANSVPAAAWPVAKASWAPAPSAPSSKTCTPTLKATSAPPWSCSWTTTTTYTSCYAMPCGLTIRAGEEEKRCG